MFYPSLLIITTKDIFTDDSNESLTIKSFVEDWPRNKLYQIVVGDFEADVVGRVNSNTFVLGHNDIFIGSSFLKNRKKSKLHTDITVNPGYRVALGSSYKKHIRELLVGIYGVLPYKINDGLKSFLDEATPDKIYTNVSNLRSLFLVEHISKLRRIPFVLHIFDDWPNIRYSSSSLLFVFRKFLDYKLKNYFHKSSACFCISEAMCKEYANRFHSKIFIPLMHSVSPLNIECLERHNDSKKILIYCGSLYLGRYETLLALVQILNNKYPSEVVINVFTSENQWNNVKDVFSQYPFVHYLGYVSQQVLLSSISKSHGLIFIESFNSQMLEYTRLSMSTKIPEYLSSCRPIIALGNKEQASIRYLYDNNAAYIADAVDKIENTIDDFMNDKDLDCVLLNASRLYVRNHLKENQKQLFLETIKKLF